MHLDIIRYTVSWEDDPELMKIIHTIWMPVSEYVWHVLDYATYINFINLSLDKWDLSGFVRHSHMLNDKSKIYYLLKSDVCIDNWAEFNRGWHLDPEYIPIIINKIRVGPKPQENMDILYCRHVEILEELCLLGCKKVPVENLSKRAIRYSQRFIPKISAKGFYDITILCREI